MGNHHDAGQGLFEGKTLIIISTTKGTEEAETRLKTLCLGFTLAWYAGRSLRGDEIMRWSPTLTRLRDVLAYLYGSEGDARRITTEAELYLARIDFSGKAANMWQSILEEALKQEKLHALIETARQEYPGNQDLAQAWQAHRQFEAREAPHEQRQEPWATRGQIEPAENHVDSQMPLPLHGTMEWDVFISHAWEDKESIARPLAEALRARGLRVWFDEFTLSVGDRLRRSIDRGLANSRDGIVILSPHFFAKEWPQKELDGLIQREDRGKR